MRLKEVLVAVLLAIIVPNPVIADGSSFGYPSSESGTNDLSISLDLGDTWQMSNGKWLRGHLGIDLVGEAGTIIYVASNGVIDKIFNWPRCEKDIEVCDDLGRCRINKIGNRGWGPTVVIRHEFTEPYYNSEDTYLETTPAEDNPTVVYTQYGHLHSVDHLEEEQVVQRGEILGEIGRICQWIPHLHFEIKDAEAVRQDRLTTAGAGFGYSGVDGHAPHRYIPQAFIAANKNLIVESEEIVPVSDDSVEPEPSYPVASNNRSSIFQRIKSFFARIFTFLPSNIAGEVDEEPEPIVEEDTSVESETDSEELETAEPVYDAEILPHSTITAIDGSTEALISIRARNTGDTVWDQSSVSLNVVGGRSANLPFRHSSWLTDLRPTQLDQASVAPGDIGTFTSLIRIPVGTTNTTFRSQLVRQDGYQFLQLGSGFSTVNIVIEEPNADVPAATTSTPRNTPERTFESQVRDVISEVVKTSDEEESSEAAHQDVQETVDSFFTGGGGSSGSDAGDTEVADSTESIAPTITITTPTTSVYHINTSSLTIAGTMNDGVSSVSVSSTLLGVLSMSTTSQTWQWIGTVPYGTSTLSVEAYSSNGAVASDSITLVRDVDYVLTAPMITTPTTSSIWYTNVSTTVVSGVSDEHATTVYMNASSATTTITPTVSSTWEVLVSTTVDGVYRYAFSSEDLFVAFSSSTYLTIVYDTIGPTSTATSTYTFTTTTLTYELFATDTMSGIDYYALEFRHASDGVIGACMDETVSTGTCTWVAMTVAATGTVDLPALMQAQDLVVRSRAVDNAGNVGTWEYQSLLVLEDEASPMVHPTILISEIAWMGTVSSTTDEWIEIINASSTTAIDTHHWQIVWGEYDAVTDTYEHGFEITIPGIPYDMELPMMYGAPIVFERTDNTTISDYETPITYTGALSNSGEHIRLLNANGDVVDEVDASAGWFAGDNNTKESMIRRNFSGESNDPTTWCTYSACDPTDVLFDTASRHDAGGNLILGTPGDPRLFLEAEL